jgi:hypothetical protein
MCPITSIKVLKRNVDSIPQGFFTYSAGNYTLAFSKESNLGLPIISTKISAA